MVEKKVRWKPISIKSLLKTVVFEVEELSLEDLKNPSRRVDWYRIQADDWVNILPVTRQGQAILIEQSRIGPMQDSLEIPGGSVEKGERDLMMAALNPNPAIMTNRCHYFLALDCEPVAQPRHKQDELEDIKTRLVPVGDLDGLVRSGQINHSLSALCIMLAGKYLEKFIK